MGPERSLRELARHDLVWLTADGWRQALSDAPSGAAAQFLAGDWPAVVRRREAGMRADHLSLGLPLPPAADGSKGRCAIDVPWSAVARTAAPLGLDKAAPHLPHWRQPLAALLADSRRHDVHLRVFGSAAMQALTGAAYLTATSDLDLLLQVSTQADVERGVALLLRHAAALPLDGEMVFPGGEAVSWKEWAAARDARVLVKRIDGVRLVARALLLAFPPA